MQMLIQKHITRCLCGFMLMISTACNDKSADDHVIEHYDTTATQGQTYIDNDEYYVAPTGGYVSGANSGILDAD